MGQFSDSPTQLIERALDRRIVIGRIETVDEETGSVEVSYVSQEGFKSFNIPHPHFSVESWIRAMPEIGSYVLIGISQFNQYPEILKIFDPSERVRIALNHITEIKPDADPLNAKEMRPVDRIFRASAGRPDGLPFRKLRMGELEFMSKGRASVWYSRRGQILEKASVARRLLDTDRSMIQDWAVGHEKLGIDAYLKNCLWDSEYFGVVRRPPDDPTDLPLSNLLNVPSIVKEINGSIAIEDRVSEKVAKLKAELETLKQNYEKQMKELIEKSKEWLKKLNGGVDTKTPATDPNAPTKAPTTAPNPNTPTPTPTTAPTTSPNPNTPTPPPTTLPPTSVITTPAEDKVKKQKIKELEAKLYLMYKEISKHNSLPESALKEYEYELAEMDKWGPGPEKDAGIKEWKDEIANWHARVAAKDAWAASPEGSKAIADYNSLQNEIHSLRGLNGRGN